MEKATQLLEELMQHEDAEPFLEPVDTALYSVSGPVCLRLLVLTLGKDRLL